MDDARIVERVAKRPKIEDDEEPFACHANDAISLHIFNHKPSDDFRGAMSQSQATFQPEYTHQIFGDDELIHGYEDLKVDLYLSARTFHALIAVRYGSSRALQRDDVVAKISEFFEGGIETDEGEFEKRVSSYPENWLGVEMFGEVVGKWDWCDGQLLIAFSNLKEADPKLRELHQRLEPLLTFFIDGFSAIDADDPNFEIYFAVYEHKGQPLQVVGFSTVYNHFAYPDRIRKRLSQIFVFPHFQSSGAGTKLLMGLYKIAQQQNVADVTLEDPSDSMKALRDKLDLDRLLQCEWLKNMASKMIALVEAGSVSGKKSENHSEKCEMQNGNGVQHDAASKQLLSVPSDVIDKANAEFKMSKAQVVLLWEAALMVLSRENAKVVDCIRQLVEKRMEFEWGLHQGTGKVVIEELREGRMTDSLIMLRCKGEVQTLKIIKGLKIMPTVDYGIGNKQQGVQDSVKERMEELVEMAKGHWK